MNRKTESAKLFTRIPIPHHESIRGMVLKASDQTLGQGVGPPDQGAVAESRRDCGWKHPRAPALRWLWKGDAVGAVVDFLEKTRVGSRASAEMARTRANEDREGDEALGQESEEDGPGPP